MIFFKKKIAYKDILYAISDVSVTVKLVVEKATNPLAIFQSDMVLSRKLPFIKDEFLCPQWPVVMKETHHTRRGAI